MKNNPSIFATFSEQQKTEFCNLCEDAMFEMATANMRLMDAFNTLGEDKIPEPLRAEILIWADGYNGALEKGRLRSEAIMGRLGKTMN